MDFSNVEIKIKDGFAALTIDGVDFPTVSNLNLHVEVGKPPELELKLYCDNFNK